MEPKEFIKSTQNNVLLNDYTLKDVEWFMAEFAKQETTEQLRLKRNVFPLVVIVGRLIINIKLRIAKIKRFIKLKY